MAPSIAFSAATFMLIFVISASAQSCPSAVSWTGVSQALVDACNTTTYFTTCNSDEAIQFGSSIQVGTCFACSNPLNKRPGYICGDGVNKLCPAGYYCPLNTTTGTYNRQIQCPDDTICFKGFVRYHILASPR